jgi:hypothetical protein
MIYTLGLKKLPFEPDCNQIIYIDGSGNGEIENLIKYNYFGIRRCFEARGYDFCYIPYLKKELVDFEKIHYNAPYAKNGHAKYITDDNFLLNYMSEPKRRGEIPPSLLYYIPDFKDSSCPDAECVLRGMPITEQSFEQDAVLRNVLHEILRDIDDNSDNLLYRSDDDWMPYIPLDGEITTADDTFDSESLILMREIEERIERLREKGIKSYIIERLVLNNKRLSQLTITKQNRIFLHDYFMEIKMTPLPKAVYFLFLKHPEGIMFSYLPDFREELLEIYKNVKGLSYNEAEARKSVWDVTDPLSNSINEKCSRIREAFVSQFDDYWAKNYYVDGKRGEPKKVALPRHLVKWE